MTTLKLKINLSLEIKEICGTPEDLAYGKAICREVGNVRFDGIQNGLDCPCGKRVDAHFCFTLDNGDGTTILVPLKITADELRTEVEKKNKLHIHNRK